MNATFELCQKLNEELTKEMWDDVSSMIRSVVFIMNRRGYGLGECGYIFREWEEEQIADEENPSADRLAEIKKTRRIANNICYQLDDMKML